MYGRRPKWPAAVGEGDGAGVVVVLGPGDVLHAKYSCIIRTHHQVALVHSNGF